MRGGASRREPSPGAPPADRRSANVRGRRTEPSLSHREAASPPQQIAKSRASVGSTNRPRINRLRCRRSWSRTGRSVCSSTPGPVNCSGPASAAIDRAAIETGQPASLRRGPFSRLSSLCSSGNIRTWQGNPVSERLDSIGTFCPDGTIAIGPATRQNVISISRSSVSNTDCGKSHAPPT